MYKVVFVVFILNLFCLHPIFSQVEQSTDTTQPHPRLAIQKKLPLDETFYFSKKPIVQSNLSVPKIKYENDVAYFDFAWEPTDKVHAIYYRSKPQKEGNVYRIKDYYSNGILQMDGYFADLDGKVPHGTLLFYDRDGILSDKGFFENGKKSYDYTFESRKSLKKLTDSKIYDKNVHTKILYIDNVEEEYGVDLTFLKNLDLMGNNYAYRAENQEIKEILVFNYSSLKGLLYELKFEKRELVEVITYSNGDDRFAFANTYSCLIKENKPYSGSFVDYSEVYSPFYKFEQGRLVFGIATYGRTLCYQTEMQTTLYLYQYKPHRNLGNYFAEVVYDNHAKDGKVYSITREKQLLEGIIIGYRLVEGEFYFLHDSFDPRTYYVNNNVLYQDWAGETRQIPNDASEEAYMEFCESDLMILIPEESDYLPLTGSQKLFK